MFDNIKKDPHITKGSSYFFETIALAREVLSSVPFERLHWQKRRKSKEYSNEGKTISYTEQGIAFEVIKNNSYFCHPENLLLAALFCGVPSIMKKALKIIEKIRQKRSTGVRKFFCPKEFINFEAENFFELLDWDNLPLEFLTEPPMLRKYNMQQLRDHVSGEVPIILENIPCHSTNVERAVKNCTEACKKAIGYVAQKALILTTQKSRNDTATYWTKTNEIKKISVEAPF